MAYENLDPKAEAEGLIKPVKIFLLLVVLFCLVGSFFLKSSADQNFVRGIIFIILISFLYTLKPVQAIFIKLRLWGSLWLIVWGLFMFLSLTIKGAPQGTLQYENIAYSLDLFCSGIAVAAGLAFLISIEAQKRK